MHYTRNEPLRKLLVLMLMLLQCDGIYKEGVLFCSVRLNYPLCDTVEKYVFHFMVVWFWGGICLVKQFIK